MAPETRFPLSYADVVTLVEEECLTHRQHTLDKVAASLRARAELIRSSHGQAPDPLADAIWNACHRDEVAGAVYADPRTIARAAYLAVADLIGQDRTDPAVTSDPRTETNPHD